MAIFSRKHQKKRMPVVPPGELGRLPGIGRTAYLEGQPSDVSGFYLEGFIAAGSPSLGSAEFDGFLDGFLGELLDGAASNADGWAFAGAMRVAIDFIGPDGMKNSRFVEIVDCALPYMATAGVSGGYIPMFLLDRWRASQ